MIVQACYSVFNESQFIENSVRSVLQFCDVVYVIDGPYKGFPHNAMCSTDGTLGILRSLGSQVIVDFISSPLPQFEKRSLYFRRKADWYFIIDADEIVVGQTSKVRQELSEITAPAANVTLINDGYVTATAPRFIKYAHNLRYHNNHFTILSEGCPVNQMELPLIESIRVIHLGHLRRRDRKRQMRQYRLGRKMRRYDWKESQ